MNITLKSKSNRNLTRFGPFIFLRHSNIVHDNFPKTPKNFKIQEKIKKKSIGPIIQTLKFMNITLKSKSNRNLTRLGGLYFHITYQVPVNFLKMPKIFKIQEKTIKKSIGPIIQTLKFMNITLKSKSNRNLTRLGGLHFPLTKFPTIFLKRQKMLKLKKKYKKVLDLSTYRP